MKLIRNYLFILILIIIIGTNQALSSGSQIIGYNINNITDIINYNHLAITTGQDTTFELTLTDYNLNTIRKVNMPYPSEACVYDPCGNYLCTLSWDLNHLPDEESGKLLLYNPASLEIIRQITLPSYPVKMAVDSNSYAYVACRANVNSRKIDLVKIDLDTGLQLNLIQFGCAPCNGICLNSSETSLYIDSGDTYITWINEYEYSNIQQIVKEFDASDFSEISYINVDLVISDIIKGSNNIIYVSHGDPGSHSTSLKASISVINTLTNSVERVLKVDPMVGCRFLKYSNSSGYLYACPIIRVPVYDDVLDSMITGYDTMDKVLRFNINNNYEYDYVTMAAENIGVLELGNGNSRLYAGPADGNSRTVYYIDL
jgi:hypothetical protein